MSEDQATMKAVKAYARQLQADAEKALDPTNDNYDPYAKPYTIGEEGARKLCQRVAADLVADLGDNPTVEQIAAAKAKAPARTIAILKTRARARQREREAEKRADDDKLRGMLNRRKRAERKRAAERGRMRLGKRLDAALAVLSLASSGPAAQAFDHDIIHGSTEPDGATGAPGFHGDPYGRAYRDAEAMVERIEADADRVAQRALESTEIPEQREQAA